MSEDREASEDVGHLDGDPYEELAVDDEVDDPFAELAAGTDHVSGADQASDESGETKNAGNEGNDSAEVTTADPGRIVASDDVEDPFDALGDIDEDLADDAFERMEVEDLGEEDVWEALSAGDTVHEDVGATPVGEAATDHVVDKREYCQRCPHFSSPPETACTHEEGTVVEVLTGDQFRVRGCPMVGKEGPAFDRGK